MRLLLTRQPNVCEQYFSIFKFLSDGNLSEKRNRFDPWKKSNIPELLVKSEAGKGVVSLKIMHST